jgi:4a-hydroxytetrahydrobiopterin dehydratase
MKHAMKLSERHCQALPKGTPALNAGEISTLLGEVAGWAHSGGAIRKTYGFRDYAQTTAFVNAVAWIAQREDHHPDIAFGYNRCEVAFNTHSIGGISMNDFICAAKIEALL